MRGWPNRRLLVLSAVLVVAGAALLVVQDLGTFNTTTCVHDPPSPDICYQNPDPWPLFVGIALAVGGLGLLLAGVVAAARRPVPKPSTEAPAEEESTREPTPGEGTSAEKGELEGTEGRS